MSFILSSSNREQVDLIYYYTIFYSYQLMSKCWNRVDNRPTFRYCLEVLRQINEQHNVFAHTEAEFPHDVPYKYVSSDDSLSLVNEKLLSETSHDESKSLAQASIPKYLELAYDENDNQSNDNFSAIPAIPNIEHDQRPHNEPPIVAISNRTNSNNSGYEIPSIIEGTSLDINANNELNTNVSVKSRTLSNSSTVSNRSDRHFHMIAESLPPPPESCKRSSLIFDRDHAKIYPTPNEVITRQSGWV